MRNFFGWKAREVRLFERQFLALTSCHYKIQIWAEAQAEKVLLYRSVKTERTSKQRMRSKTRILKKTTGAK